ncbi:MAG: hypothetical protein ACKOE2_03370 [Actinomycetales bacterium]
MTNPNTAHLTLVVDRSGSMNTVREDAQGGINDLLTQQFTLPCDLTVTLVEFDDHVDTVTRMASTAPDYRLRPRGRTRLLDAVGLEIIRTGEDLAAIPEHSRPDRVLFVVVTDGMENASTEYSTDQVRTMVEHQRTAYRWQFQFIGADEAAWQGARLGMASMRYAKSARGTSAAYAVASVAIRDYLIDVSPCASLQMAEAIDENGQPIASR